MSKKIPPTHFFLDRQEYSQTSKSQLNLHLKHPIYTNGLFQKKSKQGRVAEVMEFPGVYAEERALGNSSVQLKKKWN